MNDYKNSIWAKEILEKQNEDGMWGHFHTLSEPNKKPITTEQALRRLEILGYTIEDECIAKAIEYMNDHLLKKRIVPNGYEKKHNWNIFTDLILATWVRRFTYDSKAANRIAQIWVEIVSNSFIMGEYSHSDYLKEYKKHYLEDASGFFSAGFVTFYQVSIISKMLDENIENLVMKYILNNEKGIYYFGYNNKLIDLPECFSSKQASRYIACIELLSEYRFSKSKLKFVYEWLESNRDDNNNFDMGIKVKDFVYFPLSDSWRIKEYRSKDCTYRINTLIQTLKNV